MMETIHLIVMQIGKIPSLAFQEPHFPLEYLLTHLCEFA